MSRRWLLGGYLLLMIALVAGSEASLERAYLSSTGVEAARRFDDLNADVIYVRHENGDPA